MIGVGPIPNLFQGHFSVSRFGQVFSNKPLTQLCLGNIVRCDTPS
jgi:hypothetical protein